MPNGSLPSRPNSLKTESFCCACSHSRSRGDKFASLPDSNTPPVPAVPQRPGREGKVYPMPSVLPPGYPEGTCWIRDRGGRPHLETPAQYRARYGIHVRRTVVQPLTRPEDVGREGEKRAKTTVVIDKNQTKENTCGDKNVLQALLYDPTDLHIRTNQGRPPCVGRQPKEGGRRLREKGGHLVGVSKDVIDSLGRRLNEMGQCPRRKTKRKESWPGYRPRGKIMEGVRKMANGGVERPCRSGKTKWEWKEGTGVNLRGRPYGKVNGNDGRHGFGERTKERNWLANSSVDDTPPPDAVQPPVIESPSSQKPFLQRMLGGIIGRNRDRKTPRPVELPPVNHASTTSRPLFKANQRSRTKSM
ncbi:hypothetical protein DL96DRAFT_1558644 [Flagelloscypha sp. PMI_526]|nr:hypothetical protein DL96DRAFT_1558644 [Flagelloscypha sp. PMI_526]